MTYDAFDLAPDPSGFAPHDQENSPLVNPWTETDILCMEEAIRLAESAMVTGEVPVGAVLAKEGRIVAASGNRTEARGCALAHAEILVLEQASKTLGRYGFEKTTLYVTLEPCVMCAGAIVAARVASLVFGTRDARFGGCRSIYRITNDFRLNHRLNVREGLLTEKSSTMLREFFRHRRLQKDPGRV